MNVRAHILVEGRVQGVFYRSWTARQAQGLGLSGWVKNLTDGRVEAVIEGPKSKVEEVVERCKQGPRFAGVKYIDVSWEPATGEYEGFEIVY
jgi:acylphosphatase